MKGKLRAVGLYLFITLWLCAVAGAFLYLTRTTAEGCFPWKSDGLESEPFLWRYWLFIPAGIRFLLEGAVFLLGQ